MPQLTSTPVDNEWKFRFSLRTLLLLTTAICCDLGFLVYELRQKPVVNVTPRIQRKYTPGSVRVPPEDLDFRKTPEKQSPAPKSDPSRDDLFGLPPVKAKLRGE